MRSTPTLATGPRAAPGLRRCGSWAADSNATRRLTRASAVSGSLPDLLAD
jgi:hypothetical protein